MDRDPCIEELTETSLNPTEEQNWPSWAPYQLRSRKTQGGHEGEAPSQPAYSVGMVTQDFFQVSEDSGKRKVMAFQTDEPAREGAEVGPESHQSGMSDMRYFHFSAAAGRRGHVEENLMMDERQSCKPAPGSAERAGDSSRPPLAPEEDNFAVEQRITKVMESVLAKMEQVDGRLNLLEERTLSRLRMYNYGPVKISTHPPQFDGQSDWKSFRVQFLNCAKLANWDPETKVHMLGCCLTKSAQAFHAQLPEEDRNDYARLMDILERRYGDDPPETYQALLAARK